MTRDEVQHELQELYERFTSNDDEREALNDLEDDLFVLSRQVREMLESGPKCEWCDKKGAE